MDHGDVAGREPARFIVRRRVVDPEIGGADPRPAHLEFARGDAVPGQFVAVVPDDLHRDAENPVARLAAQQHLLFPGQLQLVRSQRADAAERARLSHAPALDDGHAVLITEVADHLQRHGRAADDGAPQRLQLLAGLPQVVEQHRPDRRHRGRERHRLLVHQLRECRRVAHPRPREDELRAGHRRAVGQAPGVRVEHRHDGQHAIVARQAERIDHAAAVGMQHGRAVAEEHALRVARGARGVAQRACAPLVEHRPVERVGMPRDEGLVVGQRARDRRRHRFGAGHHDRALDRRQLAVQRREHRQQRRVDEQQLVLGVVDDELQLLRKKAWIDRVQHGAQARDRVVELEVAIVVPGQRAHPVAGPDARGLQRVRELARAAEHLTPVRAVPRLVESDRHDLAVGEIPFREPHDLGDQQRRVHHQTVHGSPPGRSCPADSG